jgi:hypothetical protein
VIYAARLNIGRRVGCRWLRGAEHVARIGGERDAQVFFVQKFETGHVEELDTDKRILQ